MSARTGGRAEDKRLVQITFHDGSQRVLDGWFTEGPEEIVVKHHGRDAVVGSGLITERFFKVGIRSLKTSDARDPKK